MSVAEMTRQAKGAGGRPSSYTSEIAAEICKRMGRDGQTLRKLCAADDMPSRDTIYEWLKKYPEFADQYVRAREELVEYWADEIIYISDSCAKDDYNRARLQADNRKWLMSKLMPRKYGDKLINQHEGSKEGDPIRLLLDQIGGKTRGPPSLDNVVPESDDGKS